MTEESAKVIFFVATDFFPLRYLESSFGPYMGIFNFPFSLAQHFKSSTSSQAYDLIPLSFFARLAM